eukprot:415157-Rhodomonas_salina.1
MSAPTTWTRSRLQSVQGMQAPRKICSRWNSTGLPWAYASLLLAFTLFSPAYASWLFKSAICGSSFKSAIWLRMSSWESAEVAQCPLAATTRDDFSKHHSSPFRCHRQTKCLEARYTARTWSACESNAATVCCRDYPRIVGKRNLLPKWDFANEFT